jgi:hypothetical protein
MPLDLKVVSQHKVAFGIGAALSLGAAWYIHNQRKGTSSAAAASVPATGTAGYGYGYGSGLGASGSLVSGGYGYGYGGAYGTTGIGGSGSGYGYGGYGTTTPVGTTTYANNAAWAEAAETALTANGVNPATASAAIGKYLLGRNLTSDEANIIAQAIGFANYPPVPGASGYPPAIHQGPAGGQQTGTVTVPKVTGMPYTAAAALLKAKGLAPHRAEPDVGTVTSQDPAAKSTVKKGATVVLSGKGNTHKKKG